MDTRFWGPSGWKMLHLITFDYQFETNAIAYAKFFESLPYILPCKFCRASLTDYYRQYPFLNSNKTNMNPDLDLKKWMYNIHNCVNDKLREQGLNPNQNPKYKDIKKVEARVEGVNKIVEISQGNQTLEGIGKFPVIYADPPWRYEFAETENREIENHYPTMTIDDICAMDISKISTDDSILFIA